MHQAWHIFKKDTRHLYREIGFLLALAAIFGWIVRHSRRGGGDISDALELIYVASVAYMIARLVHEEAIPGENQFWITRPYRWPSLLAAKTIFVIAFIHLPVLLMQLLLLLLDGFSVGTILPGLLWTQVLILCAISLPLFAVAAMSATMVAFIGIILEFLVLGAVTEGAGIRSINLSPESVDWTRMSFPLIAALAVVPPVLYIQYKYRRTRHSAVLWAAAAICAAGAYVWTPGSALFAIQSLFSKRSLEVQIRRDLEKRVQATYRDHSALAISVPLRISGVPEDVRLQVDMYDPAMRRADGRWLHLSGGGERLAIQRNSDRMILSGVVYPDRWFIEGVNHEPVTLVISFYLTLYGNRRDKTIPFRTTPADALDGLRCFDGYFDEVVCWAPFRWPGTLVFAKTPWGSSTSFTRLISYSPFPARLQLDPVAERSVGNHWSNDRRAAREVTIEIEEPLAYVRRDVEVPDISLGGW
jgi:hypothetical protein